MRNTDVYGVVIVIVFLTCIHALGKSKYSWMKSDRFDMIDEQYRSVTEQNCRSKNKEQLTMRADVVSQLPVYNQLLSRVWYRNRTSLIHIHNMALNRAFFYSYVLQKMNDSQTFSRQPSWLYFYLSAVADVNANPGTLNGSALYFDNHCHYPNWYTTVPFNRTLPLFGPKAFRWDDYQDQDNWLREPTRQVVQVMDLAAGTSMNYTHPKFKMSPWYSSWLPDLKGDMDSLTKFTYYIGVKASNVTGRFIKDTYDNYAFFGPPSPGASDTDPRMLPVQFTAPYFDCGGSNKWVVSAVSPVVDFMPRYSNFTHLRRQRIVALSVMDTDFVTLDFNACQVSVGNPGPSYLSGIDRCKAGTLCKHTMGYGFKRGGYTCHCRAGFRYPWFVEQPYQGSDIEVATEEEYKSDFSCTRIDYRQVLPVKDNLPRVSVEGAGVITSSGGQDTSVQERKKRSPGTQTSHVRTFQGKMSQNRKEWDKTTHGIQSEAGANSSQDIALIRVKDAQLMHVHHEKMTDGYTVQEVMELAEKFRELRRRPPHGKTWLFQDEAVILNISAVPGEGDNRGLVDVDVEKMYQEDVAAHRSLKKMLRETGNVSTTLATLRHSISNIRDRHIGRFHADRSSASPNRRHKRAVVFDDQSFDRMMRIFRRKSSVTWKNCHQFPNHLLKLPGDVTHGVWKQFESEGRTALRLSHFMSMYLQNVMPDETFGNLRGGGRLHIDQMYGEVLANVMGNFRIYAAGVFFDRHKFENQDGSTRELFGPWAFRKRGSFYVMDAAGLKSRYVDEDWFMKSKSRFSANFQNLRRYKIRPYIRSDPNGTSSVRHEYFPMTYRAATYELGFWTSPFFRCDGNVDNWVMTYVSPFFGLDRLRTRLEFRGVATVDVPLSQLEINQCPQSFTVANAFKNTARCDYLSTTCSPLPGFPFLRGSYRCLCKMGFEYPHADGKYWIEGSLLELEYEKKKAGIFSRFDQLKCRVAGAAVVHPSLHLLLLAVVLASLTWTAKD